MNLRIPQYATVAASAVITGLIVGCGILTAPISGPQAIADNANFVLDLAIVDQDGKPLDAVIMSRHLEHYFWTPIAGEAATNENAIRIINQHTKISERGNTLNLNFSHDGFLDVHDTLSSQRPHTIQTEFGSWTTEGTFPVVMISREKPDAGLRVWQSSHDYSDYPDQNVLHLPMLWGPKTAASGDPKNLLAAWKNPRPSHSLILAETNVTSGLTPRGTPASTIIYTDGDEKEPVQSGVFYVTFTPQLPRVLNAHGDVDPEDINLPGTISLHVSGPDNGFKRIQPRLGYAPIVVADEAPTSGYSTELAIDRPRLKEMRAADHELIIEAHEYFFMKVDGHYGKGSVAWTSEFDLKWKKAFKPHLKFTFWMQSNPGDTNLTWHHGIID